MSKNRDKEWWSAADLAAACLPGLPTTRENCSRLLRKIESETGFTRPRAGRGGGIECHITALPEVAREELDRRAGRKYPRYFYDLPYVPEDQMPAYFLERMNAYECEPEPRRALLYKLLLAEFVMRFAQRIDVEVSEATCLVASAMTRAGYVYVKDGGMQIIKPWVYSRMITRTQWRPYKQPASNIIRKINEYISELNCVPPDMAKEMIARSDFTSIEMIVDCMTSLSRAGEISSLPLTKRGMRQLADRVGISGLMGRAKNKL